MLREREAEVEHEYPLTPEEQVLAAVQAAQSDPEAMAALLAQIDAEVWRGSFSEFCRAAWHVIEPATKLVWNWHHELLCNVLQGLFETWHEAMQSDGKRVTPIRNCVINCPPNSLKSKLCVVFYPVWIWLRAPGAKLVCISVNEKATQRDARAARDLIKSDWFQRNFAPTWTLKEDQDAISNYGTTGGGERLSIPSGSVTAGLRGDLLIGDDLNDPADSGIESEILKVNDLWDSTQYSRTNDPLRSLRITVQQRLKANDHTGHIISKQGLWSPENADGWLHVVLSAELDERRFVMPEPLAKVLRAKLGDKILLEDPRKVIGESIDPVRMPPAYLAAERIRFSGTGSFSGQLLQRPALVEGALIKRNYFGFFRLEGGVRDEVDELDTGRPRPSLCNMGEATLIRQRHHAPTNWDLDFVYLSIDCALKKTTRGSNWGLLAVGGKGGRRYVLDDRSQRGDILEIITIMREMCRIWRPDKILIEDKAAGDELKRRLIDEMSKGDMPMITLESVKVGMAGKEERLDSCLSSLANSMVSLRDGAPWLEEFVEEMATFPHGARDDRVDSLTQVLNYAPDFEADQWPDF